MKTFSRCTIALTMLFLLYALHPVEAGSPLATEEITLELIMSHPDWMGRAPQNPYWAADGNSFYYEQKREGEEIRDLIQADLAGKLLRVVPDEERGTIDVSGGDWSKDRLRKVYSRKGDIYIRDVTTGEIHQLTRTTEDETDPHFLVGDRRIWFHRGDKVFVRDLDSGLEVQPADLLLKKDPEKKEEKFDYLKEQQTRLFDIIREKQEKEEKAKERERQEQEMDPTRPPLPWYLGEDVELRQASLSPTGQWMLVALRKKKHDPGQRDNMPNYVSEDGYVASREVRSKVGTLIPETDYLLLLDLKEHKEHSLDLATLPNISDDPLSEIKERTAETRKKADEKPVKEEEASDDTGEENKDKEAKSRPVRIPNILWSEDGSRAAVQVYSYDNKDRWIAAIDFDKSALVPLEHMHDDAWINWRFNQAGWLLDSETLFYTSEESGYSQLYLRDIANSEKRRLTEGDFVVSNVQVSPDGRRLYYDANPEHPGVYETYRVDVETGKIDALSDMGGRNSGLLSPNGKHLLVTHSTTQRPPELFVQPATPGGKATQVTETVSERFVSLPWVEPEIVAVPSTHHDRAIYSRVYTPPKSFTGPRPAAVFVHGAGYMQNSHKGWSNYFREFMFHTLLTQQGYVVLDMDYRASAGYGRDWRTAIYRQMGTPELEDLKDGVRWLAENKNVDPRKIGVYGGSYGGFLTFMALFREPDLFACGASLRPVTDWAHYNDGYTSRILNTPTIDPEAYEGSSPIEYADGLTKPLLIAHGMQDDNVFFQDTVRLVQRLIELKKENWEVAIYPIEPHGFREPTSWLDEYRRIFKLFEEHLK